MRPKVKLFFLYYFSWYYDKDDSLAKWDEWGLSLSVIRQQKVNHILIENVKGKEMQSRLDTLIDLTLRYYKQILILTLLAVLPLSYYFIHQRYVNHVEIYFNETDADLRTYKRFQETYGNEHQFLIVFEDQEIFTPQNIETIRLLIIFRKWFLTLICMVPNIFPIAMTLSIMGWFNIPLDVATIMIASIVLGIAVDDTIHFTVRLKRNFGCEKDLKCSIEKTFSDVGRQMVITSLLLFFGFSLLVFGSVIPVKTFGLLTGFSMIFALLGDLFILPASIMVFKPRIGD